jgi:hypothetical protein
VSSVADTTATPLEDFTIDWQTDEFTSPKNWEKERNKKNESAKESTGTRENGQHKASHEIFRRFIGPIKIGAGENDRGVFFFNLIPGFSFVFSMGNEIRSNTFF